MCGIAGMVGVSDKELLNKMLASLQHRGPDGGGTLLKPSLAMGMRRLAIIDLENGDQPIFNEDKTVAVIFNGEIYNHLELRRELESRGHKFTTRTDTEVIVHLYEEYGDDCVLKLAGMFALAVWDSKKERLLLARDRLGIKPLYIRQTSGKLLFASELKALLRDPSCPRELDYYALHLYLSLLYVPAPRTIFQGITKLMPGHRLIWQRGRVVIEPYWRLTFEKRQRPVQEIREELLQLLKKTVKEHLMSDVPLGVFLSGGMDSGSLVALASQVSPSQIKTFSIGYGPAYSSYDELKRTRLLARHFGCDHHEYVLEPKVVDLLPRLVQQFDEPFADSSAIPTYLISQATKQEVSTVLTGIGGDELFAGYPRYLGARLSLAYERLPMTLRKILAKGAQHLKESPESRNIAGWIKRFSSGALLPLPERYASWMTFFTEEDRSGLYTMDFRARIQQSQGSNPLTAGFAQAQGLDPLDQIFLVDQTTYLPDDLLALGDRMSMAHSLELRVPYCDHRLAEFSASLMPSLKTKGLHLKALFKDTMRGLLPEEILSGPKQGFMLPLAQWLNQDLAPLLDEFLTPETIKKRGYLNPDFVQGMRRQHQRHQRLFTDQLWALLNLELWHRLVLEEPTRNPAEENPVVHLEAKPKVRKSLRVLLATDIYFTEEEGGSSRIATELARHLIERGHEVTVVTRGDSKSPVEETQGRVHIRRYPHSPNGGGFREAARAWGAYQRTLRSITTENSFDAVVMNHPFAGFGILRQKTLKSLPSVGMYYGPWHEEYGVRHRAEWKGSFFARISGELQKALRRIVEHRVLRHARKIVLLSHWSQDQLVGLHHVEKSRIVITPGGVDASHYAERPSQTEARASLGLEKKDRVLFTVRNLLPRMGLENLLMAVKILSAHHPDLKLLIGGQGPMAETLSWLVKELDLEHCVRLTGFIPEEKLPLYYAAADATVLPSTSLEGFGLVILESLAGGTPVVGTPVGAIPEVLGRLDAGLVAAKPHASSLAQALDRILSLSAEDRRELEKKCRSYARDHFSWERLAGQVEESLLEAAEKNPC